MVVDEGHAFRNPETQRAEALRKMLAGLPVKDLVLLTATPVNNSLFDLYNLLSLFIKNDAAFADRGILSLRKHFADAAALDPDDLSPDRLFDVLDAVAVRRTRRFVKDFYAGEKVGGRHHHLPQGQRRAACRLRRRRAAARLLRPLRARPRLRLGTVRARVRDRAPTDASARPLRAVAVPASLVRLMPTSSSSPACCAPGCSSGSSPLCTPSR